MITRRAAVIGGGCSVCAAIARATTRPIYFEGCLISAEGFARYRALGTNPGSIQEGLFARNRHWHTTGNVAIDRDLDRALGVVADLFSVNPAFGFYDPTELKNPIGAERNNMNAFATPENTNIPSTHGTVAFGWDLFRQEFYEYDNTGLTVMTIVAHEFGHILQMKRGFISQIRNGIPLKSEINADFLSGYFLGTRKLRNSNIRFEKAGEFLVRMGRANEGNPTRTHGNSRERLDAAEAGFRVAYLERKSIDEAVAASLEYVQS